MATTTNYGWETPDDTDLVKDGAAAMRTLGNAIDTSLVDLRGGTTGQVLTKASNSQMDFSWTSVDPLTILDAKGDLISATAADTPARLAVGSNGQFLRANSSTATGLEWQSVTIDPTYDNTVASTNLSGSGTVTLTIPTAINTIFLYVRGASPVTAATTISVRLNGNSTANNYLYTNTVLNMPATYATTQLSSNNTTTGSSHIFGKFSSNAASVINGFIRIDGAKNTGLPQITSHSAATDGGGNSGELHTTAGWFNAGGAVTSVSLVLSSGNFDAGSVIVFGA